MNFYIVSLKHTNNTCEHITFWGKNHCGNTPVVGDSIGEYDAADAEKLNDGKDHIAVPVEAVKSLLSPEPYWKPGARFYDQRGEVVDNTRKNWNRLIEASIQHAGLHPSRAQRLRRTRHMLPPNGHNNQRRGNPPVMNVRLCQIINDHNSNVAEFARMIGANRLTVHRWINGKREPLIKYLRAIQKEWPDVNLHWLITGETK